MNKKQFILAKEILDHIEERGLWNKEEIKNIEIKIEGVGADGGVQYLDTNWWEANK